MLLQSSFELPPRSLNEFLGRDQPGPRYYLHGVAYQPSITTFGKMGLPVVLKLAPLCVSR